MPLRSTDLSACLGALHSIGEASGAREGFARRGVTTLRRLVAAELTTLSICHLETGHLETG